MRPSDALRRVLIVRAISNEPSTHSIEDFACVRKGCPGKMRIEQKQIEALAGFRNTLRRFLAFSEDATRAQGVTPQQYQAMLAIKAQPRGTMAQGELKAELLLKANSTVQLIDRLARMGLVRRQRSEDDQRLVQITLTEAGNAVVLRLAALHLEQLSKRKKQLADILRQLKNM